jgi:Gpi18-like mannosyltransferase
MPKTSDQSLLKSLEKKYHTLLSPLQYPVTRYLVLGIIFAIVIRWVCVPNKSVDYKYFLDPWYEFIANNGGFSALKYGFADYTPPYLYWILIAATLLSGLPKILAIKLFAMTMDFICAFLVYKIVRIKYPEGKKPIYAFLAVILSPTVIYNSALWGQCDVIYTTGIVACVYFLSIQKQIPALISFGIGLSFKLQAMFLSPLLLIFLVKQKIKWYYLPIVPLVYILAMVPAWIAGRPMADLLLVYFNQANKYKELAKNSPNLYQWIPNDFYNIVVPIGLLATVFTILLLAYLVYRSKLKITQDRLIYLATLSVLFMPYILPKMHERYFYPADMLSIIFAFYFPQYTWVAIMVQMSSFFSYLGTPIFIQIFSIPLGFTLWFIVRNCDMIYPQLKFNFSVNRNSKL